MRTRATRRGFEGEIYYHRRGRKRGSCIHPVSSQASARNKQSVDANDNYLKPAEKQKERKSSRQVEQYCLVSFKCLIK